MQTSMNVAAETCADDFRRHPAGISAVSWPAIFAGGLTAIALSLVLTILGSGLGFAAMSPWAHTGASATALGLTTVVWLIIMQWASAGVGGYIAGRLRTKWHGTHSHEVFFRDTAHGLLAWALASVLTAGFLVSAVSSVAGGASHAAMHGMEHGPQTAENMPANPYAYYVDSLFRQDQATTTPAASPETRAETARILTKDVKNGALPDNDKAYIAKLVSAQTGLAQDAAVQRVDATVTQISVDEAKAKEAADTARKASATLSIFTALSMFIGAFIACLAAALGGKRRDDESAYIK